VLHELAQGPPSSHTLKTPQGLLGGDPLLLYKASNLIQDLLPAALLDSRGLVSALARPLSLLQRPDRWLVSDPNFPLSLDVDDSASGPLKAIRQ